MGRYHIVCTLIEHGGKFIYLQSNSLSPFKVIAGDWYDGLLRSFWCFNSTYLAVLILLLSSFQTQTQFIDKVDHIDKVVLVNTHYFIPQGDIYALCTACNKINPDNDISDSFAMVNDI